MWLRRMTSRSLARTRDWEGKVLVELRAALILSHGGRALAFPSSMAVRGGARDLGEATQESIVALDRRASAPVLRCALALSLARGAFLSAGWLTRREAADWPPSAPAFGGPGVSGKEDR